MAREESLSGQRTAIKNGGAALVSRPPRELRRIGVAVVRHRRPRYRDLDGHRHRGRAYPRAAQSLHTVIDSHAQKFCDYFLINGSIALGQSRRFSQ